MFQDKNCLARNRHMRAGAVSYAEEIGITQTELSEPPSLASSTWEFPEGHPSQSHCESLPVFPPEQIWNSWKTGNKPREKLEEYGVSLMAACS